VLADCLTAVSTAAAGGLPGRKVGVGKNLSVPMELPDTRHEEKPHSKQTFADSRQKQAVTVQTKLLSQLDTPGSKEDSEPQMSHTNLRSYKPSYQTASQSCMDFVNGRSKSSEREGGDSSKQGKPLESERRSRAFLTQETPVRDEKRTDWSMTSSDSDMGLQVPRLPYLERKVEPVKPFSVSAASACEMGEFGSLSPDVSDLTVYNEISKKTPHTEIFAHTRTRSHREPTPGSECENQQGACSRPVFSELRQRQQDSGFDSPFYLQK